MRSLHPEWVYGTFGRPDAGVPSPLESALEKPVKKTQLSAFRLNTWKSESKQTTLSMFRMNSYDKQGRGWPVIVNQESDKDSCPEEHRDEGSLVTVSSIESRLGRSRRRIDGRARAFLQSMNHIDAQVFKAFDEAARPANLHPLDLRGRPEAKVNTHIAIRDVAGPAAHLVNERVRTGFHRNLRADPVAIGFAAARRGRKRSSNRPQRDPVVAIANVVHQQHRRRVHVADHRGHPAVIPQIAHRQSARGTHGGNPPPRPTRNNAK